MSKAAIVAGIFNYYPSDSIKAHIAENEQAIQAAKDKKDPHSELLKRRARLDAALKYSQYVESQGLTTQQGIEALERALSERQANK